MRTQLFRAALLLLAAFPTYPRIALDEPFNYLDGPLVAVSNGIWKTHSGTAAQVAVSNGQIHLSQRQSEDVSARLNGGPFASTNALNVYTSFTARFTTLPAGAGAYFAHLKDASATTGFRSRIFALTNGAAVGCFRLGVAAGANTPSGVLERDLVLNTPYFIVFRSTLANNATTLWLNPQSENDPCVTSTDETAAKAAVNCAFREAAGIGELDIDEVRVGTEFEEVLAGIPPAIDAPPSDQAVDEGASVHFEVTATGTAPLTFQWSHDAAEIPGATDRELNLAYAGEADAGIYAVRITNRFGAVSSQPAALTVRLSTFRLRIACDSSVRLSWTADREQSYSVWRYERVGSPPVLRATSLVFPDSVGQFDDEFSPAGSAFYKIGAP